MSLPVRPSSADLPEPLLPTEPLRNVEVLRRVLAGLRDGGPTPQVAAVLAWPGSRSAPRRGFGFPAPPAWAAHSVIEDGGVTHERVCHLHPSVLFAPDDDSATSWCPTDVSVSVADRPVGRRWVRGALTVQVEGGSYPITEARRLAQAIEALIALTR